MEEIKKNWGSFAKTCKGLGERGNLDALLRSACQPLAVNGDTLILGFYYEFHKRKVEDPKCRTLIEKKLKEFFKHSYKIECVIVEKSSEVGKPIMTKSNKLVIARKTGLEQFHSNGKSLGFNLESFWQWSTSDIISNATRGILAEYIVARALGLGKSGIRDEWAVNDLQTTSGITIQVKSSAYIQSWHQEKPSQIIFNVEKTRPYDPDTNILSKDAKRSSGLYVFAVLTHKDKSTIDPLNIDQWQFYVLPTKVLDTRSRSQHSITLKSLEKLGSAVSYDDLGRVIEDLGA